MMRRDTALMDKVEAMLEVESALTSAIEKVAPWLDSAKVNPHHPRVRPIPQSMEEVKQVLAYARVLAARTSAPAGWNPNAPVVGFSTPNPLPHQLRGGALAALQLERARQQQLEQSKKRQLQEMESKPKAEDKPQPPEVAEYESSTGGRDPKRREVKAHERQSDTAAAPQRLARPSTQLDVSMNLSDSSSDEDDD